MPKIWFRKSKNAYYLQISRTEQKRLGRTRAEADVAYRQWLIDQGEELPKTERRKLTIAEVAQEFLDHTQRNNKPKTYESYCYFVVPFVERFGSVRAATFPPLSFTKWLDEHEGWKACRRNAIVSIKRLFNWAVNDAKVLPESPLKGIKKPKKKRRNRVMSEAERDYILQTIRDEQFREYVFALLDSGCRPGELMVVTADHVSRDCTKWTFDEHKTEREGEARIVYLSPALQELTRKLVALYPEGPMFRSTRHFNSVRRPWTRNGIRCRFKRLREKVTKLRAEAKTDEERAKIPNLVGITSYVCRHTFTTDALTSGLPVPVVSALLGHKSMKMVDEHYNHTDQATEVLRDAAAKAGRKPRSAGG